MTTSRRKLIARLVLGLGIAAATAWLARLDYASHISLDVLDLIPIDEREPELAAVRSLALEEQGRVALFAIDATGGDAADAEPFIASLRDSSAFAEVVRIGDTEFRDSFGEYIFRNRFALLLPEWLAYHYNEYAEAAEPGEWVDWLAGTAAEEFENYLGSPGAMAFEELLTADPLLLVPEVIERVQGVGEAMMSGGTDDRVLIWGRGAGSPLDPAVQQEVFDAVENATSAVTAIEEDTTVRWTGVARFAAHSRQLIKAEVMRLNVLSLVAVLFIAALCLKRLHQILHLAPVVACSLLGAWAVTTLLVPRVHVLVLVVGALLCGIAIDYALHIYLHPLRRGGDFAAGMRAVLKPLLVGAFTTMVGFSFLLLAELPFIRHLGIFVTSGIFCAVASAILWFSQVSHPSAEVRPIVETPFDRLRSWARGAEGRLSMGSRIALTAVAAVAVAGPWFLNWHDDVRELEPPAPALYANDRAVRASFGESPQQATYLTRGNNPAEARQALDDFLVWHRETHPDAERASLGFVLPTQENFERLPAELGRLDGFARAFRSELDRRGFEVGAFRPFFVQWEEALDREEWPDYESLVSDFTGMLRGPLALMMSTVEGSSWFATVTNQPAATEPPAETATISAGQLQTLNRLFSRYRQSATRLSLMGLAVAGFGILALYGPRQGLRIFALPAIACLFAFGALGLAGQTLNIFHLLGAFLGVCLSFDYAIFAAESAAKNRPPPASIRVSALTTGASFGVLATSSIPVVSALGTTVAIIVLTALLGVELVPRKPPSGR